MLKLIEILPLLLMFFAFLASGKLLMKRYPLAPQDTNRDIQLDGLRSLLACGVMLFHWFGVMDYVCNGSLDYFQASRCVKLLGLATVPVFFITAYLFAGRVLNLSEVSGKTILKFSISRIFRLVPTTITVVLVGWFLGDKLSLTTVDNLAMVNLASSSIVYPAFGSYPLSQTTEKTILFGPHWTLHYELLLYLFLSIVPVLAFRKRNFLVPVLTCALLIFCVKDVSGLFLEFSTNTWAFVPGFCLGVTRSIWSKWKVINTPFLGFLGLILLSIGELTGALQVKLIGYTFFLYTVVVANKAKKILELDLLRSLGESTYSIYLIHGLVQFLTARLLLSITDGQQVSRILFWFVSTIGVGVTVLLARYSYEHIEKNGIALGKRCWNIIVESIDKRYKWMSAWI
jgi:peptidoglycan/LPS O-acetylase OafA/YrhL